MTTSLTYLKEDLVNQKFTDCKLIIRDNIETIELNVHRVILAANCPYFRNQWFDKSIDQFEMRVFSAQQIKNIIMSFYDPKYLVIDNLSPKDKLMLIRCQDFLCLDRDLTLLTNIQVHPSEFEMLVELLSDFDLAENRQLIRLLQNNIPAGYDLSLFSPELLAELNNSIHYFVTVTHFNNIKIYSTSDGQLIRTISIPHACNMIAYSHDNVMIAIESNYFIHLYDIRCGEKIDVIDHVDIKNLEAICFTADDKYIIALYGTTIIVFDVLNKKEICRYGINFYKIYALSAESIDNIFYLDYQGHIVNHTHPVSHSFRNDNIRNTNVEHCFSPTNRYLAYINDNKFGIIDLKTEKNIWQNQSGFVYPCNSRHYGRVFIAFSPDEKFFAICNINHDSIPSSKKNFVGILDIITNKIIQIIEEPSEYELFKIAFSRNGNRLFVITIKNYCCFLSTWDVQTGELIHRTDEPIDKSNNDRIKFPVNHF